MKTLLGAFVLTTLMVVPVQANAWFFFFIPGKAIDAIGDALTGSEGNNCVSASARVGDAIALPNGGRGIVKSLSGTSSRCTNPEHPIRALLEFTADATVLSTRAGLDLDDSWEAKTLTDQQRASGVVLYAINRTTDSGLMLAVAKREGVTDMDGFVGSRRAAQMSRLNTTDQSDVARTVINGLPAWRFHVSGTPRSGSQQQFTYLHTILEGANEIVLVNAWTSSAAFNAQRPVFEKISEGVKGISPPSRSASASNRPTASAPSADQNKGGLGMAEGYAPKAVQSDAAPPVATQSVAQRLRELQAVYNEGLIDQKEYEERKRKILDSI